MTEHSKKFSNFFGITEIDSTLVLKNMHVNVSVMKIVTLKIFWGEKND